MSISVRLPFHHFVHVFPRVPAVLDKPVGGNAMRLKAS